MTYRILPSLTLSLAVTASLAAPGITENADVLAPRDCELEASADRTSATDLPRITAWGAQLSCGVGLRSQLGFGYARARGEGERAEGLRLGGKTLLRAGEPGQFAWTLAYGIDSARAAGTSYRFEGADLVAVATYDLADSLRANGNIGVRHERDGDRNTTIWSLGIETTDALSVAADIYGDDRNRPGASTGIGYAFGGGFSATLNYAVQFETPRLRTVTLGAKLEF